MPFLFQKHCIYFVLVCLLHVKNLIRRQHLNAISKRMFNHNMKESVTPVTQCDYFATHMLLCLVSKDMYKQTIKVYDTSVDKCDYTATLKCNLNRHVEAHHAAVRRHFCDTCDYKAHQMSDLKLHVEAQHECLLYSCDQCNYKATHKGNLKKTCISSGARYSCDQYYYKAKQKINLKTHV